MIDHIEVEAQAGDGGHGIISFRREKFVPYGGPDGGDGGRGGHVVFVGDANVTTLAHFQRQRHLRAPAGGHGSGAKRHGRNGADLVLSVPLGTIVSAKGDDETLRPRGEITKADQRLIVATGGRGGWGNARLATPVHQAPWVSQKGETGEHFRLVLDLKLLADVGIVGLPNAGKSTLLAASSAAQPKIGTYPFTTLEPNLGVADLGDTSFVLADIPGLIEGAHEGRGLGHEFLRHIQRTRVLIHVVDASDPEAEAAIQQIDNELALFDPALASKPQLMALNKMDLPAARDALPRLEAYCRELSRPCFRISAATREGVGPLLREAANLLAKLPAPREEHVQVIEPVRPPVVTREDGLFVVQHAPSERLAAQWNVGKEEAIPILRRQFQRLGLDRVLRRAGVRPGDRVRIGELELEWAD